MRIAVLVRARIWGGLETHAVDLVRSFTRAGHECHLACIAQHTADLFASHDATLPIKTIPLPRSGYPLKHWIRELRRLGADACVFEKSTLHAGSFVLDLAARRVFGRRFITIEQLEPPVLGDGASRRFRIPIRGLWWYRQHLRGRLRSLMPYRVVCISEAVRRGLESQYGFPSRRIAVIANGVDVERYHPANRAAARRQYGVREDVVLVATACRLIPQKGVEVAITAFARAVTRQPDGRALLLVAGEGPEKDRLRQLCVELSMCERVRFLGFVADMPGFVPAVDVFLVPSRIEAQGIVVIEAMASACEVIASRVGGIPDVISNPHVGTLVPAGDVDAWTEAIERSLARAASERAVRGAAARDHVVKDFSTGRQADRILQLLAP
jgi:glycosyltransferase involved in cell wall biosynthesis